MAEHTDIDVTMAAGGKVAVVARNGRVQFADQCSPGSAVSRNRLLANLDKTIAGVVLADIEQRILSFASAPPPASSPQPDAEPDPQQAGDEALAKMPADVVVEARARLRDPALVARIATDLEQVGIVGEHCLALSIYAVGTSRLLPRPASAIVQGGSSSGKSHTIAAVASLFPAECKLLATDLTTNALYYLEPGSLRHRFVVAGERSRNEDDARAETTRALREMISEGVLRKLLPVKEGDTITTRVIESRGPIAFVESTTLAQIFEEDRNRALLLASDDSPEQTRAVVGAIAARYAHGSQVDADRVRQVHHAMQRLLRRVDVRVPFAALLAEKMPVERPEARRAISQVLGVVQAVALLHQFQRHEDPVHGSIIEATVADYRVARKLVADPLARSLESALPDHVRSFAEWLLSATKPAESWTTAQLEGREGCRWSRTTLFELVKPLHACGFLGDAGQLGRSALHRIAGPIPDAASTWLPSPEDLA